MPNWTGGMVSTSDDDNDDDHDEQDGVATRNNNHLRKCLLCNIQVRKNLRK